MTDAEQSTLEYLNYLLALLGIGLVFFVHRQRLGRFRSRYAGWLAGGAA